MMVQNSNATAVADRLRSPGSDISTKQLVKATHINASPADAYQTNTKTHTSEADSNALNAFMISPADKISPDALKSDFETTRSGASGASGNFNLQNFEGAGLKNQYLNFPYQTFCDPTSSTPAGFTIPWNMSVYLGAITSGAAWENYPLLPYLYWPCIWTAAPYGLYPSSPLYANTPERTTPITESMLNPPRPYNWNHFRGRMSHQNSGVHGRFRYSGKKPSPTATSCKKHTTTNLHTEKNDQKKRH